MSMGAHAGIKDKVPDDLDPACVIGKIIIVLRGNFLELGKLVVGNVGEVVVLVVVPDVVQDEVEGPVVGVGGLTLGEDVVLRDEVAGEGMQTQGHQRAHDHIHNRFHSPQLEDDEVKSELHYSVDCLPASQRLGGLVKWSD